MDCPGCNHKRGLSRDEVERLIDEQLLLEVDQVSDEVRNQRLETCLTCESLIQSTCLKCGCFVRFRASLINKQCPLRKW